MRKLHIGEATPEAAFITNENGDDVATITRRAASTEAKFTNPLTDEEWQGVIDRVQAALTGITASGA